MAGSKKDLTQKNISQKNMPQTPPQAGPNESYNPLLGGLQAEVSAENAPLLEFITRYAGLIAGIVIALLVVLGGMGLWNWHKNSKTEEARAELAKITTGQTGEAREQALRKLAEDAPNSVKMFVYLTLAQDAQTSGKLEAASEAYAQAAALDKDGALGLMAALGHAANQMNLGKYREALAGLRELEKRIPDSAASPYMQQMLAEAALGAGDAALARDTYNKLAEEIKSPQGAYYKKRAEQIAGAISAKTPPAETQQKTE